MHRFKRLLVVLAAALLTQTAATAGEQNFWAPMQFLLGDWEGVAKADEGQGRFSFTTDLGGTIMVRRNHAEHPAKNGRAAGSHDDQMVIYREGQPATIRAIYFDTEGHVIHYKAARVADGQVTFVSDFVPGEPRYRLSYARLPDGTMNGAFEIAPPGKPEAFARYLEWVAQRSPTAQGRRP